VAGGVDRVGGAQYDLIADASGRAEGHGHVGGQIVPTDLAGVWVKTTRHVNGDDRSCAWNRRRQAL